MSDLKWTKNNISQQQTIRPSIDSYDANGNGFDKIWEKRLQVNQNGSYKGYLPLTTNVNNSSYNLKLNYTYYVASWWYPKSLSYSSRYTTWSAKRGSRNGHCNIVTPSITSNYTGQAQIKISDNGSYANNYGDNNEPNPYTTIIYQTGENGTTCKFNFDIRRDMSDVYEVSFLPISGYYTYKGDNDVYGKFAYKIEWNGKTYNYTDRNIGWGWSAEG